MLWSLYLFIILGSVMTQSIGHFIGIVLSSNIRLAVFTSIGFSIFAVLFSNFMIPTKDLHYSLQMVSLLSPVKLVMECLFILYYGFDKCSDREFSFVLFLFDVKDEDFYINTYIIVVELVITRAASMIALLYKVNPLIDSKVRAEKNREQTSRSRRPSKAFILGLTSEFDYKN